MMTVTTREADAGQRGARWCSERRRCSGRCPVTAGWLSTTAGRPRATASRTSTSRRGHGHSAEAARRRTAHPWPPHRASSSPLWYTPCSSSAEARPPLPLSWPPPLPPAAAHRPTRRRSSRSRSQSSRRALRPRSPRSSPRRRRRARRPGSRSRRRSCRSGRTAPCCGTERGRRRWPRRITSSWCGLRCERFLSTDGAAEVGFGQPPWLGARLVCWPTGEAAREWRRHNAMQGAAPNPGVTAPATSCSDHPRGVDSPPALQALTAKEATSYNLLLTTKWMVRPRGVGRLPRTIHSFASLLLLPHRGCRCASSLRRRVRFSSPGATSFPAVHATFTASPVPLPALTADGGAEAAGEARERGCQRPWLCGDHPRAEQGGPGGGAVQGENVSGMSPGGMLCKSPPCLAYSPELVAARAADALRLAASASPPVFSPGGASSRGLGPGRCSRRRGWRRARRLLLRLLARRGDDDPWLLARRSSSASPPFFVSTAHVRPTTSDKQRQRRHASDSQQSAAGAAARPSRPAAAADARRGRAPGDGGDVHAACFAAAAWAGCRRCRLPLF